MSGDIPIPTSESGKQLAAMFTAVVASLDFPARHHLSEVVSHCHTRRYPVPDTRVTPIFFFEERDERAEKIARPHLYTLHAQASNPHLNPNNARPANIGQAPLNEFCPALDEKTVFLRMDPKTRTEYVRTRLYGCDEKLAERGYRYFYNLNRPDMPIKEPCQQDRENSFEERQPIFSLEESEQDMSDEEFSDGEMMHSDDEESTFSRISVITRESELVQPSLDKRPYFVETSAALDFSA